MAAATVKLAGVVSNDDCNGVAVWKILVGTRVLLVVSIDTILLGLNVGVFMTILLYFADAFNSLAVAVAVVVMGIDIAVTDLVGDVIDDIDSRTVTDEAVLVVVDVVESLCFGLSVNWVNTCSIAPKEWKKERRKNSN